MIKFNVKGSRVLVEVIKQSEKATKHGSIVLPEDTRKRETATSAKVKILQMGDECFEDTTHDWFKVGDKALITKYAGANFEHPDDGRILRVIDARDVLLTFEGEE